MTAPMSSEEFFDILDERGNPTGQVCPRHIVHSRGYCHATAHVWILNNKHEILLQKRSSTKDTRPGMWDISCAGHLCAGDAPLDAAVRECHEELGIIVNPSDLTFLFTVFQSYHSPDGLTRDNEFSSVYMFKPVSTLHFNISRDEVDDIKYVKIPVLQGMVDNTDSDLVPHAEEYRRLFELITANNS